MNNVNRKPYGYWNIKENCKNAALECNFLSEFHDKYRNAYNTVKRNNWLDEICSHLKVKIKPIGYWSKEKCLELSLKCKKRSEFEIKYRNAYFSAYKNNWLDEFFPKKLKI